MQILNGRTGFKNVTAGFEITHFNSPSDGVYRLLWQGIKRSETIEVVANLL